VLWVSTSLVSHTRAGRLYGSTEMNGANLEVNIKLYLYLQKLVYCVSFSYLLFWMSQRLSVPFVDTGPFISSKFVPCSKGRWKVCLRRVGIFEAIREGKTWPTGFILRWDILYQPSECQHVLNTRWETEDFIGDCVQFNMLNSTGKVRIT